MILTGKEINKAVYDKRIIIEPFNDKQIGPNSYDFRLGNKCLIYKNYTLDFKSDNETLEMLIGDNGLIIEPNKLYLINTFERMGSDFYVPIIRGRSSIGRLGLFIDITSDLIDLGSINQWTLQLHSVVPVKVYPGMLIGQVTFWVTEGERTLYNGKYKEHLSPVKSLSFRDSNNDKYEF